MTHKYAVGIDVSKATLDVCVLSAEGEIVRGKFKNNSEDIDNLSTFLSKHIDYKDQIVIESTGDYHLLVSSKLFLKFNVQIINPLISKQYINANVRKVKSDKADALVLAKIGLQTKLNNHVFTTDELHKRKIVSQIDTLEKHKAAMKLSLKNITKTFADFKLNSDAFAHIEISIKETEEAIKVLHKELRKLIKNTTLLETLEKQKGISSNTADILIAMIEDRKFSSKGALVAYSGLDVAVKQSGKWVGKAKITKRGNQFFRKYLVNASWGLNMHNEKFREYGSKYTQKGRKYYAMLVILARKLLRMIYGAINSNGEFSIDYLV